MTAFWDGFEKRAISKDTLRRAADSASCKLKAVMADKSTSLSKRLPLIKKRMDQESKFQLAALKKEMSDLQKFKDGLGT